MRELLTIEFLRPEFLLLGVLALPAFVMLLLEARFGRYFRPMAPVSSDSTRVRKPLGSATLPAFVRAFSGAVLIASLACVAADPRYPIIKNQETRQGTDIVFVFDVSKSMLAEDISPNRLEVAKSVLQRFVQNRP